MRARVDTLTYQIKKFQGRKSVKIPLPDTYDELPEWVETYYPGRLLLLQRAARSLKDAEFEDVHLVYRSLKLLDEDYCNMRAGMLTRNQFDQKCRELGIIESASTTDNRAGELGEKYFVDYDGRIVNIDRHLKYGTGTRDPRRCMRIYFFWDEGQEQVVLCYLPQHQQI